MSRFIASAKIAEFAASAEMEDRKLCARLEGTADLNAKSALDEFLLQLYWAAEQERAVEVVIDLRDLVFINSSCLKSFITWICAADEVAAPNRYRITFLAGPSLRAHSRSIDALATLADEIVTVVW
jgi:hypothetical protein